MADDQDLREKLRKYWEDPHAVSTIDRNLRMLEIEAVSRYLRPTDVLADIGCGDGEVTVQYARQVSRCVGFERSLYLRQKASENVVKRGLANTTILYGDILEMGGLTEKFDVVVTQHVLTSLADWDEQKKAIENVRASLKEGGRYLMIENTTDSFRALNKMRVEVGLEPIPQHWHSRFMDHESLMDFLRGKFEVLQMHDFGLYYFLTRVYTQMFAYFRGYGNDAMKDPIFEHSDEAARIVYEKYAHRFKIEGCRTLGPTQAFVLKRSS